MTNHYKVFIDRWTHPDYRPEPCTPEALDVAEKLLATSLPRSLREFLESFGPVGTTANLLSEIVDRDLDLNDVSEFEDPEGIVQTTMAWRDLGLDSDLIVFASDCQGNVFCIQSAPARVADSEVWFLDHDCGTVAPLGVTFKEWIGVFADLPA